MNDPLEIPAHIRTAAGTVELFFKLNGINEWALMGIQSRNDCREQLAALKAELEQEKKWKIEDPRMLREQIRVADVAFNHLHEEHAALKLKLEVTQAMRDRLGIALRYQAEHWGLYGNEGVQALNEFEALSQLNESEEKK